MCSLARIVLRGSKEPLRRSLVVIGVARVAVRVVAEVLVEAAAVRGGGGVGGDGVPERLPGRAGTRVRLLAPCPLVTRMRFSCVTRGVVVMMSKVRE
jgi:hypothetical protein